MTNSTASVAFGGKTYTVGGTNAYETNRVFDGWFGDAGEGEEYTVEMADDGVEPATGRPVRVIWQWEATKGDEPEEWPSSCWDDDNITDVEYLD